MTTDATQTITHEDLLNWNAGLVALSQRRLDTRETMKKILALFRRIERFVKDVEKLQRAIFEEHPIPEGWEGESLPVAVNEARTLALASFHAETIEIKRIPDHLRITDADLPKLMKGEEGDRNRRGETFIAYQLGWLYTGNDDEAQPPKDGEDGVEKEAA